MTINPSTRTKRRGFGLAEVAVSAILLMVALVLVAQIVIGLAAERKAAEQRQRAFQEAANVMERVTSRTWDELTPEYAKGITLAVPTSSALRGGSVDVAIAPASGEPPAKKIAVEVRWRDRTGGPEAPVRLVSWVYHQGATKP